MELISVQGRNKQDAQSGVYSLSMHTIVLLVGLDGSGKSNFSNFHLIPSLKRFSEYGKKKIGIVKVDQDDILRTISDSPGKTKEQLAEYSYMAQKTALSILENSVRYPVSSEFVILDCDAMDENFRIQVLEIAKENGYKVQTFLFDLPNEDYYYFDRFGKKVQINPHKKKIRQLLSGQLQKEKHDKLDIISSRKYQKIVIDDYQYFEDFKLPVGPEYVVIGDIHGCLDEFKELLILNGFVIGEDLQVTHPAGKKVVLVGDLVDKGYDIAGVIELAYANIDNFYMVLGNHESFVYRLLQKLASTKDSTPELRKEYFQTYEFLKEYSKPTNKEILSKCTPEELAAKSEEEIISEYFLLNPSPEQEEIERIATIRNKFFAVVESMKSFFVHDDFIVTHAPCESRYLCKISDIALKAARDFRYPKQKDYEDFSSFMFDFDLRTAYLRIEASENYKLHIFGHVMSKEVSRFKNKICVDTGCVSGGKLSSVSVLNKKKIEVQSVNASSKTTHRKELFNFFQ